MGLRDKLENPEFKPTPFTPRPELLQHANIPKPLHTVAPRTVLGRRWWDYERKRAYQRSGYRCCACGVNSSDAKERQALEAHEIYTIDYARGRMTYVEAVALCHYCHNFIHCGRLEILAQKGEVSWAKYASVMNHGRKILRDAGIEHVNGKLDVVMAPWGEWRMVVRGREFPPAFRNYEHWLEHFGYTDKEYYGDPMED